MDIKAALLLEHSKSQASKIFKACLKNKKNFEALVKHFLSDDYLLAQRAAWPLSLCGEKNPAFVKPHLNKILKNLEKPRLHDAVKRCSMRLLLHTELHQRYHASIINQCFVYLLDKNQAIAIRVFAMAALEKMLKQYPELSNELIVIIESELEENPKPAFVSRGKKVLKTISRIKGYKK